MNKKQKILKYYDQKEKLTLKNPRYNRQLKNLVALILDQDLDGAGDISTKATIKKPHITTAVIVAKQNGILAGVEETLWLLKKYKLKIISHKTDGAPIKTKDRIIIMCGDLRNILKIERLAVNILQRMSGIATATKKMTTGHKALVVSTRKTLWGLLDKKAVTVGGGGTHRLGLYDWILIKDNHLEKTNFKFQIPNTFWEIEVKNEQELRKALKLNPGAIMLDNFTARDIKKTIKKYSKDIKDIIIEASGMINSRNIKQYAKSGVDVISLGALTHSAKALDISLDIL